jgi:membrane-bound lytic murein transglycosylase B
MKRFAAAIIALLLSYPAVAHEVIVRQPQNTADSPQSSHSSSSFDSWLRHFKEDALAAGISEKTFDEAFAHTEAPLDRVIELDHKQPESTLTFERYLGNIVTSKRVEEGRKHMATNRTLLNKIGKKYGVQPRFIVALWSIETNYGKNTGGFAVTDALATLAWEGRRADFFRSELIDALKILQQEHMQPSELKGSWAGALGQCQFMPDSFLKYAVDYTHTGRRDIWGTKADVFASIANYLKSSGWDDSVGWGRPVKLPENFDRKLAEITSEKSLKEWSNLGVRTETGGKLPAKNIKASLIFVGEGDDAVPYIIYSNYKVLLKWNRSRFFATAVGTLSDKINR